MQQNKNDCDCVMIAFFIVFIILALLGIWQVLDIIEWIRDHVKIVR